MQIESRGSAINGDGPTDASCPEQSVSFTLNGRNSNARAISGRSLLTTLREELHLIGAKQGCGMGNCGACTVWLNGKSVYSCLILTSECDGACVETIEGRSDGNSLSAVQQAFIECDALQCGFCTPGQIMSMEFLLQQNPEPSDDEIRHAMTGNLCRCGAYQNIIRAAHRAVEIRRKHQDDKNGN